MRCPKCGNEVRQEEVFCGQCGAPMTTQAPPSSWMGATSSPGVHMGRLIKPPVPADPSQFGAPSQQPGVTHVVSQPTSQPGSLPGTYPSLSGRPPGSLLNAYPSQTPDTYVSQMGPGNPYQSQAGNQTGDPSNVYQSPIGWQPDNGNRSLAGTSGTPHVQRPETFYQDATEAMSILPGAAAQSTPFAYPGYSSADPFQARTSQQEGYSQQAYSPASYNDSSRLTPTPPQRPQQPGSSVLIIAGICCVVVLIVAAGLGTLFFTRNNTENKQTSTQATAVPTTVPTPTLVPTLAPTPTSIPSPTAVPTIAPDQGFAWCGPACTSYGFQTEYAATWQLGVPANGGGIQFTNPNALDQYAAFKALGPTTSTATDIVAADIQSSYASRPGYTPATATASTTIAGETWIYALIYDQGDTQRERIIVYATVHQGKAYVIELQAPDALFDQVNALAFINMLGKFQFQQAAQ